MYINGFERVEQKFEELKNLSAKYSDYQSLPCSKIVYHDIENPEHLKMANNIASKNNLILVVIALIFGLVTVACFFSEAELYIKLLLSVITVFVLIFMCKGLFTKTRAVYGMAIYKEKVLAGDASAYNRPSRFHYYISFIPDGEKVIYTRVQISMRDYNQIAEGTRVMVVNKGPRACII